MAEMKKAGAVTGRASRTVLNPVGGIIGGASDMVISILYDVSDFVGSIPGNLVGRGVRRRCPYCAEAIKSEAIKCRYCGMDLEEQEE
jgi:zinc-ribbon domain